MNRTSTTNLFRGLRSAGVAPARATDPSSDLQKEYDCDETCPENQDHPRLFWRIDGRDLGIVAGGLLGRVARCGCGGDGLIGFQARLPLRRHQDRQWLVESSGIKLQNGSAAE